MQDGDVTEKSLILGRKSVRARVTMNALDDGFSFDSVPPHFLIQHRFPSSSGGDRYPLLSTWRRY